MSEYIDQAIRDVNNARQIVYGFENGDDAAENMERIRALLASVPDSLVMARDDIRVASEHLAQAEQDRLESQDELRASMENCARLERNLARVESANSALMMEKAETQRALELHAAECAEIAAMVSIVTGKACAIRDAHRPTTRPYEPKPRSVTLNEPRQIATAGASS